jgi:hypothetical protein
MRTEVLDHYDRLLAAKTPEELNAEGWRGDSCPLCKVYYNSRIEKCGECPVKKKTTIDQCHDTPWFEMDTAAKAFLKRKDEWTLEQFQTKCRKMRDFLAELDYPDDVEIKTHL